MSPMNPSHIRQIHWLSTNKTVEYCIANTDFQCWNGTILEYINELFTPSH